MILNETIREAQLEDFDVVFMLLEQLWADIKLDKEKMQLVFKLSIGNENEFAFCYIENEDIIGFSAGNIQNAYYRTGRLCYISVLIVDSKYRGHGIGTKLTNYVKDFAIKNNCNAIELESGFKREKAHIFYEKYGFTKTAYTFALELL